VSSLINLVFPSPVTGGPNVHTIIFFGPALEASGPQSRYGGVELASITAVVFAPRAEDQRSGREGGQALINIPSRLLTTLDVYTSSLS